MMDGDLMPRLGGLLPEKISRGHRERLAIVVHPAVHGTAGRAPPGIDAIAIRAGGPGIQLRLGARDDRRHR